ncbi:MAG: hypothetical protein U0166_22240 [Acidobacteriota bacterium]
MKGELDGVDVVRRQVLDARRETAVMLRDQLRSRSGDHGLA